MHYLLFVLFVMVSVNAIADPLKVTVSILPQKYFVKAIGGKHVTVNVMVKPGFEPATYEPTPSQMAEVSQASVYFTIGVPFEHAWLDRFKAANPNLQLIDTTRGIQRKAILKEHDHTPDNGLDPHIWLSPPLVRLQAINIRDALIKVDPTHAADYRNSYTRLAQTINRVDDSILASVATSKIQNNHFMVFHPAFGYFADAYGLKQVPIEVEGKEPGPATLGKLIKTAKQQDIKVIFVEPQFSRQAATTIAHSIGGEVVAVDPLAEDWPAGMEKVAKAIGDAVAKSE